MGLSTRTVIGTECPFSPTEGSSRRTRPLRIAAPFRIDCSAPCGVLIVRASTPGAGFTTGCASVRRGTAKRARSAASARLRAPRSLNRSMGSARSAPVLASAPGRPAKTPSAEDRQLADALAGGREDRVRHGGRDRRRAWFADPTGGFLARHDVHLDLRHFAHAQHPVVVEVRLLDAAVLERDLAVEGRGKAVHDGALNLAPDDIGVYRHAAVHRGDHAVHLRRAVRAHRDLRDLRAPAAEGKHYGDAAVNAGGQRLTPARFFRGELERASAARLLAEGGAPELVRILARRVRELVDEAFQKETVLRVPDRAPEPDLEAARLLARILDMQVGNVVRTVANALDAEFVHPVGRQLHEVRAFHDRGRSDASGEERRASALVHAARHPGHRGRAVEVAARIVLAAVDELYRLAGDLREHRRANDRIGREAAAESAAEVHGVDLHLAGDDACDLGEDALRRTLGLRAGPDLDFPFAHPGGAIERLHARMREIRRLVFGLDFFRRRRGLGVAFVAAYRAARGSAGGGGF